MFKKISFGILIVLIILSVWFVISDIDFTSEPNSASFSKSAVKVNLDETVEKKFSPEIVNITVGVETIAETVDQAFADNNEKMNTLTEELEKREDISLETLNFNVNTRTRIIDDEEVISYRVLNQVQLTSEKLKEVGNIIQKAIASGANQILSISYEVKDKEQAKKEVIKAGMDLIQDKIDFMTKEMGKKQIGLDSITVNDQYMGYSDNMRFEVQQLKSTDTSIPPISPQDIKIKVNINATYSVY